MIYIGCHLSIGLGYFNMAKLAKEIGANTFQFFTRNPRGGAMKKIDEEDMRLFNEFLSENNFGKVSPDFRSFPRHSFNCNNRRHVLAKNFIQ